MKFTQAGAALVALASTASAAPTAAGNSFTINQEAVARTRVRSGPFDVQRAFQKFNVEVPSPVRLAAAAVSSGIVSATPGNYDEDYLCPVILGSPAQTLLLNFDTGSSDLWCFSGQMPANEKTGHAQYTPRTSTSATQLEGQTFSISYGDGSGALGNVWMDKVVVGAVSVTTQAVEAATAVSAEFVYLQSQDGILGLGGPGNNQVLPDKQRTFFENLSPSLAQPLFAAYLKHQAVGAYDFGFLNTAHYTGEVYYTPTDTSDGFYEITTTGFSVGTVGRPNATLTHIVDTGTSLILQPTHVVNSYYEQVPSARYDDEQAGFIFECFENLPSFSINIGGSMRTTPGSYINYAKTSDGYCYGGLQSSSGLPFGILGEVFQKGQYVVFDVGNARVGFADQ